MGITGFTHFFRKCIEQKHIKNYIGSTMLVDAIYQIFRYSIAIRNSGSDIINVKGKRLNHIWAIMQYATYLWRLDIKPIFVFDGKAPTIKREVLMARRNEKEKAVKMLDSLENDENRLEYIKYFKRTFSLTGQEIRDCIELLEYLGIPYIREDGEADLYCAPLMKCGNITGVITNDTDLLVFGIDKILKNFSGNKLVEEISLDKVYSNIITKINDINMLHSKPIIKDLDKSVLREILIDLSILLGCDYTPHIKGIRIEQLFEKYVLENFDMYKTVNHFEKIIDIPINFMERAEEAKKYYLHSDSIKFGPDIIKHNKPDKEKIYDFLHKKNNISESHANNFLKEIDKLFYAKSDEPKPPPYRKKIYNNGGTRESITHSQSGKKNVHNKNKIYVNRNIKKDVNRTINKFAVLGDN